MKYYVSNYLNIYHSRSNSYILFNGFTGALDEVNKKLGLLLIKLKNDKKAINKSLIQIIPNDLLKYLLNRGHITVNNNKEEIKRFKNFAKKLNYHLTKNLVKKGSLVIIPTYNCNLSCSYCYQYDLKGNNNTKHKIMTTDQIDNLFNNIIKNIFPDIEDKSKIRITICGGEPFLKLNKNVIKKILEYTKKYKMMVASISNATEIHKMIDCFSDELGLINKVQITLDGHKEVHDNIRVNSNKRPTFNRIVRNMQLLLDRKVKLSIRLNLSKNNINSVPSLYEYLIKKNIVGNPLVHIYSWFVDDNHERLDQNELLNSIEISNFIKYNCINIETPINRIERRLNHVFNAVKGKPLTRTMFCMKCMPNAYLYDAENNIYHCYEEAGHPEKRIGYLNNKNEVVFNDLYKKGLKRSIISINECRKCSVALLCGGGCPISAEFKNGSIFSPSCKSYKECVEKAVIDTFEKYMVGKEHKK